MAKTYKKHDKDHDSFIRGILAMNELVLNNGLCFLSKIYFHRYSSYDGRRN